MKKLVYGFTLLTIALLLGMTNVMRAQTVVLSDQFDNGDGLWNSGWIDGTNTTVAVSIDNTGKLSGANSYKLNITKGGANTWLIQRNANLPLLPGYQYTVSFLAVATTNTASINVLFEIAGDPYTKRLNETAMVTTTKQVFTYSMSSTENVPDNMVKLHFGGPQNDNTTIWVDSIVVTRQADPAMVAMWGTTPRGQDNGWTMLNTDTTAAGTGIMGGTTPPTNWMSMKGGFAPLTPTTSQALVVTGTFEMVGGGSGQSSYTWLRYALFNGPGTLSNQNMPNARWSEDGVANGYEFCPPSGTGTVANGGAGNGTEWAVVNSKSWTSTYSNGGPPFSVVLQAPNRQVAVKGVYDFAISVQPLANGSNEVRWYLIQQHTGTSTNYYWWGGSFIDTKPIATTFNSIGFAMNKDVDPTLVQCKLANVRAALGSPITVPDAPFSAYYPDNWALYGNPGTVSDWTFTASSVVGNATASGTPNVNSFAALRAGFTNPVAIIPGKALTVEGNIELVGGGFEALNSLRYGVFATSNPGSISGGRWNGSEYGNSGYLFLPPNGKMPQNATYWDGMPGTFGGIVNDFYGYPYLPADYSLGYVLQSPVSAPGAAGLYDFGISIFPQTDGTVKIAQYLIDDATKGKNYYWAASVVDNNKLLNALKYNSFIVRVGGSSTINTLNVTNVYLNQGTPLALPPNPNLTAVDNNNTLPTDFSLSQNYPNPFNPTTNIKFALPKDSNVKLVVYDMLGRVVADLVNGEMKAGYHEVNFNASNLASGVYFYSIKAGEFSSVKKLMLLK